MTGLRIPRLRERALAILVLITLITLAWRVAGEPLIGLALERQHQIAALSERLDKLRIVIARIPALRAEEASLRAKLEAEGGLWTGSSDTFVATSMENAIRDTVTGRGGRIRSSSELTGADQEGLHLVRVHVVIDGTLETLVHTMAAIDTARPPMFVENLTVTAPANTPPNKPPMLALELDVLGYMRKTAK